MADTLGEAEVRLALEEDQARHDCTTAALGRAASKPALGRFIVEEPCVVAGGPVAREAFRQLDPTVRFTQCLPEGAPAKPGDVVAQVEGTAAALLAGERVALNFVQRLAGIATATRRAVDAVAGTQAEITDTRKTSPGLRALEKYAVRMGGGVNHRFSLRDAVLWKDNHWALLEGTGTSLAALLADVPSHVPITVEVETDTQLDEALAAGVRRILVDNQPPAQVAAWVRRCGPDVAVEASGGLTAQTAAAYARAGARYISIGALTHSAPAIRIRFDLSLGRVPR